MTEQPQTPQQSSAEAADVEKSAPRILEPVRTESGAFKALVWVVGGCLLVIAIAVVARAL